MGQSSSVPCEECGMEKRRTAGMVGIDHATGADVTFSKIKSGVCDLGCQVQQEGAV
jgi:hypothetical protein